MRGFEFYMALSQLSTDFINSNYLFFLSAFLVTSYHALESETSQTSQTSFSSPRYLEGIFTSGRCSECQIVDGSYHRFNVNAVADSKSYIPAKVTCSKF